MRRTRGVLARGSNPYRLSVACLPVQLLADEFDQKLADARARSTQAAQEGVRRR